VLPLLKPEDFAVPPFPTIGERRKDKLHLAVGRAIHQWEYFEHHLGDLFSTLLGNPAPWGALRVYGTTTGFSARQQMLIQAAEAFFQFHYSANLHAEFMRIVKQAGDPASGRRNEIAHGLVVGDHVLSKDRDAENVQYFLVPSYHSTKKRDFFKGAPTYKYTSKEIEGFTQKYRLLAGEVYRLRKAIIAWRDHLTSAAREASSKKLPSHKYVSVTARAFLGIVVPQECRSRDLHLSRDFNLRNIFRFGFRAHGAPEMPITAGLFKATLSLAACGVKSIIGNISLIIYLIPHTQYGVVRRQADAMMELVYECAPIRGAHRRPSANRSQWRCENAPEEHNCSSCQAAMDSRHQNENYCDHVGSSRSRRRRRQSGEGHL
jgi:hypothetical protein